MMLAFELTWRGVTHAPINSAMLQIMAAACPGQPIRLYAAPSHLDQLRRDPCFAACAVETAPDPARCAAQVAAMRRARALRTPAALAPGYRAALLAGFPAFPATQ